MDSKVSALDTIPAVDRAADLLYIVDTSGGTSNKTTPNQVLGIAGSPVGTTDTQTLSAKTLTSPTINGATLSGTLSGTYTIGGTPTFPSSVVTLTGTQTLTNKTLTSPTINTATISNPTLTINTVSEFTAANGVTVDGLNIKDSKLNTNDSVVTANITDSSVTSAKVAAGFVVQMVSTNYANYATGTTVFPYDDTIPQNTEGVEFMTQAITPKSATNILVIEATLCLGTSAIAFVCAGLFQDSTANALAAVADTKGTADYITNLKLKYRMVAGTTSATTFKIRAGISTAGTVSFNGAGGSRRFGGIPLSSIVVTEYKA